jgi:formylglycine-generating enzyme required for sulfatase activity/tRNA A-37 threonylcarbamoyl transferase component Bud32
MREERLNSLLVAWQEQQFHGRDVPAAELCRDCPQLAAELSQRIGVLRQMNKLMESGSARPRSDPAAAVTANGQMGIGGDGSGETVSWQGASPPDGAPLPQSVPGYEILGELGRGGMGVVYKARQVKLNRLVALKMILAGGHAGGEERARFKREAEAIARLQHPHIVQIHEVGEHHRLPFFSLEFCPGGSLEKKLAGTPLPPREAAALVEKLAHAMQAAHHKGVIHRDLKPANVLLAEDGTPKVTDFGLAKKLDEAGQTASGAVMGTPSYMAPEQAGGKSGVIGPAADVYALGAVLYECLTGRPPFRAVTVMDTLLQVLEDEPVPPGRLNSKAPRDLETICLKCLDKEPSRRYASAADLAQDLRRFQAGEPVVARPSSLWRRGVKWARRRPALASLCFVLALALATVLAGGAWYNGRLRAEREKAVTALEKEERARTERGLAQVQALLEANPKAVPSIVAALEPFREDVLPRLRQLWQQADRPALRARLIRVGLALLPVDAEAVKGRLYSWMLQASDPQEMLLLRNALRSQQTHFRENLWEKAGEPTAAPEERFRALVALAAFDPDNPRWRQRGEAVLEQLLTANPLHLSTWAEGLWPVRGALLRPLAEVFRGRKLPEQRLVATTLLAEYAADRPDLLADLALDGDAREYAILLPRLIKKAGAVRPFLRAELTKAVPEKAADADKDRLAFRQANAAVTCLHLGEARPVWPLLIHSPDPSRRTYLTHHLGPYGIDVTVLMERLQSETDLSARRALLLSLGEYAPERLPAARRKKLVARLVRGYQDDPDPGIHSAVEWLLRQWKEEGKLPKLNNHRPKKSSKGTPTWYVNREGYTLTVIPGPVQFQMGSPESEGDRTAVERQHWRRIPRSFALGTKEVTVAEFRRFLEANPKARQGFFDAGGVAAGGLKKYSPDDRGPIIFVNWHTAAAYCNWLSQQDGLPEAEWCYPKDPGSIREGIVIRAGYLRRKGYRLPTEAEWEYACRAGAVTGWYHGRSAALLGKYAWYLGNAGDRCQPVGTLRPNDLGFFDLLGNAAEWCQDRYGPYPAGEPGEARDDGEDKEKRDAESRVLRGSSFDNPPPYARCASRYGPRSTNRGNNIGFRVARTCD